MQGRKKPGTDGFGSGFWSPYAMQGWKKPGTDGMGSNFRRDGSAYREHVRDAWAKETRSRRMRP